MVLHWVEPKTIGDGAWLEEVDHVRDDWGRGRVPGDILNSSPMSCVPQEEHPLPHVLAAMIFFCTMD